MHLFFKTELGNTCRILKEKSFKVIGKKKNKSTERDRLTRLYLSKSGMFQES